MPYDSTTGIITAPVSMNDIQRALGVASTDLGTLCSHANINKWAKYKPVRTPVIDTVTGQWNRTQNRWNNADDQGVIAANWWKADGYCGLSFSVVTTINSTFISNLISGLLAWTYNRPSGGSQQPYREQDFAGYFHYAVPPVGQLAGAGRTIYVGTSGSGMRQLTLNYEAPNEGDENLSLSDFTDNGTSLTEYYLGVLLYVSASKYRIVTSQNKIGTTGSTLIECEIGYSDVGTWQVMPFISSIRIDAYGSGQVGRFMSAGYDSADTIIIASSGTVYQIYASGVWSNTAYTQVGIQIVVTSDNSAAKTFTGGLTVYIYETNDDESSGAGGTLVAQYTYSTTFTVPANGSYTIPANQYSQLLDDYFVTFMNVTRQAGKEYWVTARFVDGTTIDNQYDPVQDVIMPDI